MNMAKLLIRVALVILVICFGTVITARAEHPWDQESGTGGPISILGNPSDGNGPLIKDSSRTVSSLGSGGNMLGGITLSDNLLVSVGYLLINSNPSIYCAGAINSIGKSINEVLK